MKWFYFLFPVEAEVSPMQLDNSLILKLLIRLFHITFDNINNCSDFGHGSFTCNRRELQDYGEQKCDKSKHFCDAALKATGDMCSRKCLIKRYVVSVCAQQQRNVPTYALG